MKYNNFLITGMGRSGTLFLSKIMNRSQKWTVLHEPKNSYYWVWLKEERFLLRRLYKKLRFKKSLKLLQNRFNRDYYGEVNSYLRYVADYLIVAKKGVIIRNPIDLTISIYNRKYKDFITGKDSFIKQIKRFKAGIETIDKLIEKGYYCIYFEKMVSDKDYLQKILTDFGILDYIVGESDLVEKINVTKVRYISKFKEIDNDYKRLVIRELDWFRKKYYPSFQWE